jgi:hypothetical protein
MMANQEVGQNRVLGTRNCIFMCCDNESDFSKLLIYLTVMAFAHTPAKPEQSPSPALDAM